MMHSTVIAEHRERRVFHSDGESEIGHSAEPALRKPGPLMLKRRLDDIRFIAAALAFLLMGGFVLVAPAHSQGPPSALLAEDPARFALPPVGLRARDVAVVINDSDPSSGEIGRYYAARRGIASERVIHVRFAPNGVMNFGDWLRVKAVLDDKVGPDVQAYALAWTLPFRVECMSVTAAFALGFDPASYCAEGCQTTKMSEYFNSRGSAPFTDHKLRPAMLLAGKDVETVKQLIDRGLRSDETWPEGKAYLLNTSDGGRNVRAQSYERVRSVLAVDYPIEQIDADSLEGKTDVMFHFTGWAIVANIATNHFLDGAIADHLTSWGGSLWGGQQTIATEWINAGATGSYGTVVEPCNFRQKFPDVGVVMSHYLAGESLVEAYWKSVLMPGQGVFVGDPLARPFGGIRVSHAGNTTVVRTRTLWPGRYIVEGARSQIGPFQPVGLLTASAFGVTEMKVQEGTARYFRVRPAPEAPKAASAAATAPVASSAPE
jgi:uncharacterized protein (TIGR03790 family)